MQPGYLALVLHAHLPFVRHPEYEDFLEERWLFEAITDTYVPLLQVLDGLIEDQLDFRLTISLSPLLITMLNDSLLKDRYLKYLSKLLKLADQEIIRTKNTEYYPLAVMYRERFTEIRNLYQEKYQTELIVAFRRLQDLGKLELLTCAATHAYLPLLEMYPSAVKAQIKTARDYHSKMLGQPAEGIWLPECGYYPGLDKILQETGIQYSIIEPHGVGYPFPPPKNALYTPIRCQENVIFFIRDPQSSEQVWSPTIGYPTDSDYCEFYRDIGFELPREDLYPFIHQNGIRTTTGFKYYRITGKAECKQPYLPAIAIQKAEIHAEDFLKSREKQLQYLGNQTEKPIVVTAFDAELLGHWWFEGPRWLDFLLRKAPNLHQTLRLTHLKKYLENSPSLKVATPHLSSWGCKGYSETWLNPRNDWIYPHLHKSTENMIQLAKNYPVAQGILKRALNQAARELILAQGSDWAFILHNKTTVGYAQQRIKNHLGRFNQLYHQMQTDSLNADWLAYLEYQDNIFPDVDYRVFADNYLR